MEEKQQIKTKTKNTDAVALTFILFNFFFINLTFYLFYYLFFQEIQIFLSLLVLKMSCLKLSR